MSDQERESMRTQQTEFIIEGDSFRIPEIEGDEEPTEPVKTIDVDDKKGKPDDPLAELKRRVRVGEAKRAARQAGHKPTSFLDATKDKY